MSLIALEGDIKCPKQQVQDHVWPTAAREEIVGKRSPPQGGSSKPRVGIVSESNSSFGNSISKDRISRLWRLGSLGVPRASWLGPTTMSWPGCVFPSHRMEVDPGAICVRAELGQAAAAIPTAQLPSGYIVTAPGGGLLVACLSPGSVGIATLPSICECASISVPWAG